MSANNNRRDFLKKAGLGMIWAVPATLVANKLLFRGSVAQAQAGAKGKAAAAPAAGGADAALVMVKESDPQAQTLGYHENAAKVDTKKWTKRAGAAGQKQYCYNCMFYQAKGDAKTSKAAPCTIFAGKGVAAKGWCNSWTQNPKVQG